MRAIESSTALQLTSTSQLDVLVLEYSLANGSSGLSDFERSAIVKGIEAELGERIPAWRSGCLFPTEVEELRAELEDKEEEISDLKLEISMLEHELEEAKKNGQAKVKA